MRGATNHVNYVRLTNERENVGGVLGVGGFAGQRRHLTIEGYTVYLQQSVTSECIMLLLSSDDRNRQLIIYTHARCKMWQFIQDFELLSVSGRFQNLNIMPFAFHSTARPTESFEVIHPCASDEQNNAGLFTFNVWCMKLRLI
jgi:hypothetical protein